jgi:hypothetical protein
LRDWKFEALTGEDSATTWSHFKMKAGLFDRQICDAWRVAGRDLGIRIAAPFVLTIEGNEIAFEAFVRDFGGPMGAVAVASETARFRPMLTQVGYFVSQLFPSYRVYTREHFIATLDDWRWFGSSDEMPSWYTGKPWS